MCERLALTVGQDDEASIGARQLERELQTLGRARLDRLAAGMAQEQLHARHHVLGAIAQAIAVGADAARIFAAVDLALERRDQLHEGGYAGRAEVGLHLGEVLRAAV